MRTRTVTTMLVLSLAGILFSSGCKDEITTNDVLSDPSVMPRVIFTIPAGGSDGPYELFAPGSGYSNLPHLIIRFNKLIRIASIKPGSIRATGFDRPVSVNVFVEYYRVLVKPKNAPKAGSATNTFYDDLLAFVIRDSANYNIARYNIGRVFTITLDSTIEDINGNHLEPSTFSYRPEPSFRVVSSSPKNGDTDISVTGNVAGLYMNSRVRSDFLSHLTIQPSIQGSWGIPQYDSSIVYFTPNVQLPYGTHFTVSVDGSAHDINGNLLRSAYSFGFTTRTFRVSSPFPQGDYVSPAAYVGAYCTGIIDTGTVRSAFTITPAAPGIFALSPYSTAINYLPLNGLAPNTMYAVSISTGLRSSNGTPLVAPYNFTFTTDSFKVSYTSPGGGTTGVSRYFTTIAIYFNAQISASSAPGSLTISPPLPGSLTAYEGSPGNTGQIQFTPSAPMAAFTMYTFTVNTVVKTKTGENLPRPYSFSFVTGD